MGFWRKTNAIVIRLTEEVLHESIDARTESLSSLRELGPPDLAHLLRQQLRNPAKQVRAILSPNVNENFV